MAWEILAIWAIVGGVVVWFIRDEKQRRDRMLSARAKRFAETPYRRVSERPRQEDETLASAYAARTVAAMEAAPAPMQPQPLAPHAQGFLAQLRADALGQA